MPHSKISVLRMQGNDMELFRTSFGRYVAWGDHVDNGERDYNGSIGKDGNFYIVRRGREKRQDINSEARLEGKVFAENDETVIEYTVRTSAVFQVCFVFFAVVFAAVLVYAIWNFAVNEAVGAFLPASFFGTAFLVMVLIAVISPDKRALEKTLMHIAQDYADEANSRA